MAEPMIGMPRESGQMIFVPRPHQLAARDAILAARREGRPGFLLGDLTGLGKTLSVWAALAAMPEDDILVVCPKGGMPQWRRTMAPTSPRVPQQRQTRCADGSQSENRSSLVE